MCPSRNMAICWMQGCHRGINRHPCLPEEDEAGGGTRGGRDGAMPSQVRPDPQSQRKDTGGFRSPGGGDDVGGGGLNRRAQLLPDHGIDLPNEEARQRNHGERGGMKTRFE